MFLKLAETIARNLTFGAPAVIRAGNKGLLRIVSNENSKDWVAAAPDHICAHHSDSCFSTGNDRIQKDCHACMEQIGQSATPSGLVHDGAKVCGRNVPD